jgi:hypothetical protein
MSYDFLGYLVQLVLVVAVMLGIYALLRGSLRKLLDELLKLPAGTTFYLRSLLLVFLLAGLSKTVGDKFSHEEGTAFMEYVWDVASTLQGVLELSLWWFIIYLVQITILTAVLHRRMKNEQ